MPLYVSFFPSPSLTLSFPLQSHVIAVIGINVLASSGYGTTWDFCAPLCAVTSNFQNDKVGYLIFETR